MSAWSEMEAGQIGEDGGGEAVVVDADADAAVWRCARWGFAAEKASAAAPSKGVAVALDRGRRREEKMGSGGGEDGEGDTAAGNAGRMGEKREEGKAEASSSRRRERWVVSDPEAEDDEDGDENGSSKRRRKAR